MAALVIATGFAANFNCYPIQVMHFNEFLVAHYNLIDGLGVERE